MTLIAGHDSDRDCARSAVGDTTVKATTKAAMNADGRNRDGTRPRISWP